jgi:predicted nuclease of predicted toxin-antitoxin system
MPWVNAEDMPIEPLSKRDQREVEEYLRKKKVRPRFYADENFPRRAVELLWGNGLDLVTATDAGLTGHSDEDHLAFARREKKVLLTCDRDFLDDHKFPLLSCPPVVVFDFREGATTTMLKAFLVLNQFISFPEKLDKWCKFGANLDGWTATMRYLDGSSSRERWRVHKGRLQVWEESAESH